MSRVHVPEVAPARDFTLRETSPCERRHPARDVTLRETPSPILKVGGFGFELIWSATDGPHGSNLEVNQFMTSSPSSLNIFIIRKLKPQNYGGDTTNLFKSPVFCRLAAGLRGSSEGDENEEKHPQKKRARLRTGRDWRWPFFF